MKKLTHSSGKPDSTETLETLKRLLGKRTKSIVLINNIDQVQTGPSEFCPFPEVSTKR